MQTHSSTDLRNKWIAKTLNDQKIHTLSDLALWVKPTEDLAAVLVANENGQKFRGHRLNAHLQPKMYSKDTCQGLGIAIW